MSVFQRSIPRKYIHIQRFLHVIRGSRFVFVSRPPVDYTYLHYGPYYLSLPESFLCPTCTYPLLTLVTTSPKRKLSGISSTNPDSQTHIDLRNLKSSFARPERLLDGRRKFQYPPRIAIHEADNSPRFHCIVLVDLDIHYLICPRPSVTFHP